MARSLARHHATHVVKIFFSDSGNFCNLNRDGYDISSNLEAQAQTREKCTPLHPWPTAAAAAVDRTLGGARRLNGP